ncbi:MAG: CAP domain-containing protein [Bacillota bacterium]
MVNALNRERAQNGLAPLKLNPTLTALARQKAGDMVKNNYFAHQSPTLGSAFDQMKRAGVYYTHAGENLGEANSVYSVDMRLLASPTHRANILNANFTEIGIGVVDISPSGAMVAEFFIGTR